ncbi:MAG: phosphotransferase [Bdellovibrio sp.]|nr:phosphotransferase [Bdellovibrio sp.]
MRPEQTEKIYVEEMFRRSCEKNNWPIESQLNVIRLTGDASTRKYFRVCNQKSSFVACLDNPITSPDNDFLYVCKLLRENHVRVPLIYDNDLSMGYILEEDLGDITFIKFLSEIDSINDELSYYTKCLDEIIKIHKINIGSIAREQVRNRFFDFEKLYSEIQMTLNYFCNGILEVHKDDPRMLILESEFKKICQALEEYPVKVLCHRDYHSRNIMVKNGELIVIDFQDARIGTPFYDLVSLLEDCYYQIDEANIVTLKKYYYSILRDHLGITNAVDFDYFYELSKIQRVFKAIGSFAYIYITRNDKRYLKYIGFAMEKIKAVLFRRPEFITLRKNLFGMYYGN